MQVSYYSNLYDTEGTQVNLETILRDIKTGKYREQIERIRNYQNKNTNK